MRELHCVFNRGVCGKQRSAICRIDIVPLIISHIWLILVIFSAMNNKVFMHQSFYISRKKNVLRSLFFLLLALCHAHVDIFAI